MLDCIDKKVNALIGISIKIIVSYLKLQSLHWFGRFSIFQKEKNKGGPNSPLVPMYNRTNAFVHVCAHDSRFADPLGAHIQIAYNATVQVPLCTESWAPVSLTEQH